MHRAGPASVSAQNCSRFGTLCLSFSESGDKTRLFRVGVAAACAPGKKKASALRMSRRFRNFIGYDVPHRKQSSQCRSHAPGCHERPRDIPPRQRPEIDASIRLGLIRVDSGTTSARLSETWRSSCLNTFFWPCTARLICQADRAL